MLRLSITAALVPTGRLVGSGGKAERRVRPVEEVVPDLAQSVGDRLTQGVRAGVAPEAVQAVAGEGGGRAHGVQGPGGDLLRGPGGGGLGRAREDGDLRALLVVEVLAPRQTAVQGVHRLVGEGRGGTCADGELA